jgi:hypothetical protein
MKDSPCFGETGNHESDAPPAPTPSIQIPKLPPSLPGGVVSVLIHLVVLLAMGMVWSTLPKVEHLSIVSSTEVTRDELSEFEESDSLALEVAESSVSDDVKVLGDPFAGPPAVELNVLDANVFAAKVELPAITLALTGREQGSRKELLAVYGGTALTEAAVLNGLRWLEKNQEDDGSWSLKGPYRQGSTIENRLAATAMALLAFQGYGETDQRGEFKDSVARGWKKLLEMQDENGKFCSDEGEKKHTYGQAQATIALCELYAMTKDQRFRGPAQKAVDYAVYSQSPQGGWRYAPKQDSDTSVTGWYVMALKSAAMAGLDVPSLSFHQVTAYLDSVGLENQSKYGYLPHHPASLAMSAEGLLCRQYLGWKRDDERLRQGLDYLLANPIDYKKGDRNVYYWYYATQTLHHMGGKDWDQWNQAMRVKVPMYQVQAQEEKGSWNPVSDRYGQNAGRLYTTCLSIYMLEVYYRHLPIYKYELR